MSDFRDKTDASDSEPEIKVSPDDLGDYADMYIDSLWENLDFASHTAEDFLHHIASLVHHARHLSPREHAQLALLIRTPFKRPRARPVNHTLDEDVANYLLFSWSNPTQSEKAKFVAELAQKHNTSKENVRRALYKWKKESGKDRP